VHQRSSARFDDLFSRRLSVRAAHGDIIMHAHVEQDAPLRDARNVLAGERIVEVGDVLIVELDHPALRLVNPQEELRDC